MSKKILLLNPAAALIATTSFSCWLQSLKWFFLIHFYFIKSNAAKPKRNKRD